MAGPRGYSSYRGRGSKWKTVLAVVLVLVILLALGTIAIQQNIVYDEMGTPHLPLFWQAEEEAAPQEDPSQDLDLTIQEPETPPRDHIRAIQSADMPLRDWETARARLTDSGTAYDSLVLTMKDSGGHIYYDSAAGRAVSGSAVKADDAVTAALTDMHSEEDLYTVARISCLLDPIAAQADVEGMGLKNTGGYIFYDGNNANWLDPAKEGTVNYVCAIAQECAAMGFDEILLADLSYPTVGKIDKIDYGGAVTRQAALCSLVTAVADALAPEYPEVKISVELPAEVIDIGYDETAGLALADIASEADRIYAVTAAGGIETLSAEVSAFGGSEFVPELAVPVPEWEGSSVVLSGG